jgi:uncharacterized protein YkwD
MLSSSKKDSRLHNSNGHQPRVFVDIVIGIFLALVVVSEVGYILRVRFILTGSSYLANVISSLVVLETNNDRQQNNIAILQVNSLLTKAAQEKANDMAVKGYFAHVSPDGKQPWYWLTKVGYSYEYAGENLAINFIDSKDVVDAWMRSPEHRANILNTHYNEIGIATAEGVYKGSRAIFVVQFFGNRKPVK